MNETTATVEWFDDVDNGSYLLAEKEYNVIFKMKSWLDDNTQIMEVTGAPEDVSRLVEDIRSGDVRPMCNRRDLDEDAYAEWLQQSVQDIVSNRA